MKVLSYIHYRFLKLISNCTLKLPQVIHLNFPKAISSDRIRKKNYPLFFELLIRCEWHKL